MGQEEVEEDCDIVWIGVEGGYKCNRGLCVSALEYPKYMEY